MIDAGHADNLTAYAAVNKIRIDDLNPYIYKTHDGGKTWKKIVKGLPADPVNTVREDPFCRGLLFAGTETAVYVSFNDGDDWLPLRLNMPATSIRDLVIKDNDLVVGTHGRSFWILDDIAALRDLAKSATQTTTLYITASAYRVRWNMNTDTPLPQEEPAGQNPPDGAIIDYYLDHDINSVLRLDILDSAGKTVRAFSSADKPYDLPPVNIPLYWIRPQQILPATLGAHRFIWDLHTQPLDVPPSYPIAAIYGQTAPNPTSPWVLPGKYTVKLTAEGKTYTQSLTVKMDPRVKLPFTALQKQYALSHKCYTGLKSILLLTAQLKSVQSQIHKVMPATTGSLADSLKSMDAAIASLLGGGRQNKTTTVAGVNNALAGLMDLLQDNDMPVTSQAEKAVTQSEKTCVLLNEQYKLLTGNRLKAINEQLERIQLEKIIL